MSILAWIVLGLIAGAIAKALMPGSDPGGIIVTMLIGIVGAFLGGFLGNMITGAGLNGFSLWSIVLAVVGAMLLLWIYRMTTRDAHHDLTRDASSTERLHAGRSGLASSGRRVAALALLDPARTGRRIAREVLVPGRDPSGLHRHDRPRHRRRVHRRLDRHALGWGTSPRVSSTSARSASRRSARSSCCSSAGCSVACGSRRAALQPSVFLRPPPRVRFRA